MSCLLTARVNGCSRDPDPPARTIPFSIDNSSSRSNEEHEAHEEQDVQKPLRGFRLFRAFVINRRGASATKPQSLSVVLALLHLLAPGAVLEIPPRGGRQAVFEDVARRPPELPADLRRVDGV